MAVGLTPRVAAPRRSRQTVVMGPDDEHPVSRRWSQWRAATDLDEYYTRWSRLEVAGESAHGEADFIESLHPSSVLDAGCGMGRVAIELARRGIDVVGVDLDDDLLEFARQSQPSITWVHADLATMRLGQRFGMVAMPGNVMMFCRPTDRQAIIENAVEAASSDMSWKAVDRYSTDYVELQSKDKVRFFKTPDAILKKQLEIYDQVVAKKSAENPLFKEIVESQLAFARRTTQWEQDTVVGRKMAYDHYFGPNGVAKKG